MSLAPKLRTQQAHNILSNTSKQLANTLEPRYFRYTPHHKCMNSSCKKARHHGYKGIATRTGQPRLKGNQTDPTLLREMKKLPLCAVGKDYYKAHYLPNATNENPMLSSGSDFKSPSVAHPKLPNNGVQSSPSISCSPTAENLLTGSTNYP